MPLLIDNYAFPSEPVCDDPRESVRLEENEWNAREALWSAVQTWPWGFATRRLAEKYGLKTWQAWLMFVHARVAKYYGVDRDKLLSSFLAHYGPSPLVEALTKAIGQIPWWEKAEHA